MTCDRPIYILKLRPAPGSDGVKALRWALKILWRRFGLRCVSVEQEGGKPPRGTATTTGGGG